MKISKILLAGALVSGSLFASTPLSVKTISLAQAQKAIDACVDLAKKNGWAMSAYVVDRGDNVKAGVRMDGALPSTSVGAKLKASTALAWWSPTSKVADIVKANPNFKQFPGILPIGGGVPFFSKDKQIIGAIGIAGNTEENDMACANAAMKALSK